MSLEKSTPYRNAWYRDLLEKEAELKQYTDDKVAQAIELPEVTSADNGDLLAAVDGEWDKSDKLKTIMNAGIDEVGKIPMVGATGEWGLTDYPSNELPSVTSADNGKVAGVVNGNWNTMDIPNELPAVTSADNGNILQVVNGAWSKATSSTNVVYYKLTNVSSGVTRYLANNKTIGDIKNDLNNGKTVIILSSDENTRYYFTSKTSGGNKLIFVNAFIQSSTGRISYLESDSLDSSNQLTYYGRIVLSTPSASGKILISTSNNWVEGDFPKELPTVSAADNGSVLKVVNGQWAVGQVASSPIPISSSNSINAITVEGSLL